MNATAAKSARELIFPQSFDLDASIDLHTRKLAEFFQNKGLPQLKREDGAEQWYADWIEFQASHGIYAAMLSPKQFSTRGEQFDLLRYARFLETFAYFSPAHGYSLQVSFLGLFSILMGTNDALKREAVVALENGGLFAFGVSEKSHGSDLLGNEFRVADIGADRLRANGSKYYIGNANVAAMISILARKADERIDGRLRRAPFVLFALRPSSCTGFKNLRKIPTLGVRSAFVGEFDVVDHELPASDIITDGRGAWDAMFGTVTLGKFFLGFGSIGICEHAIEEAVDHLTSRTLYGKPAIEMPHLRLMMSQAYARLTAMKLYAFRALDYVHAAAANDRRYLLFCAVQKAMVSTQGVAVMALLSECMGAKGLESQTYFEMALRDVQLIPGLEGSAHINLVLAAQFTPRYCRATDETIGPPPSLLAGEIESRENAYLFAARTGAFNTIAFAPPARAFQALRSVANVRLFSRMVNRLEKALQEDCIAKADPAETQIAVAVGRCVSIIAYAQLIAENATRLALPAPMIATIFQLLSSDLSAAAMALAAVPKMSAAGRAALRRIVTLARTSDSDWDHVAARMMDRADAGANSQDGPRTAKSKSHEKTPKE